MQRQDHRYGNLSYIGKRLVRAFDSFYSSSYYSSDFLVTS